MTFLKNPPRLVLRSVLVVVLALAPWVSGADEPKGDAPQPAATKPADKPGELKKYGQVITKEARTSQGVFTVHRIDDKVYFEIPPDAFGKLMLWQTEVAKASAGAGYGGSSLGSRVVKWERRANKVYLWQLNFDKHGDGKAIQEAVDSATMGSIVYAFSVEAEGRDRAPVINVTQLFSTDVPEFSAARMAGAGAGVDAGRSYVEEVKAFPTNIETRSMLTFRVGAGPMGGARSVSMLVHYSMALLPEKAMRPRYFDSRVGYFTQAFEDYSSSGKNWVENKQYISRYRLEKKDPKAEVSEPVKPIVFYLSREVPEKWREYMKKGVEDWQPVFEKAGFRNAIICKYAPTVDEDPSWDPEDARYSVIRWVALPIANAMGPHVHDPRSGEIISAHIIVWHDVLKLVQQWYFVQCAALDPQAAKLPFPDELTGRLLRQVITHEVGHTLGLRHNQRASSAYTIAQLRDPKFCEEHGTTASIMSYGRYNYVAQPGDDVKQLIPKVGPYDFFAIEWGYKPIAGADTPDSEKPELDKAAARQMKEPWLRFGGEDGPAQVDPTVKTENIGNDPLEATAMGLKNLDRVMDLLVSATERLGEDETLLGETYGSVMSHRANWLRSVVQMVGGVVETRALGGRGKDNFTRLSREKQQEAVKFLMENAFTTPRKLLQPSIVNRFEYLGVADAVTNQQSMLLAGLLSGTRFRLMMDAEVLSPKDSYTAMQYLTDVQDGIWSELKSEHPTIDACRRKLQRAYIEQLKNQISPKEAAGRFSPGNSDTDFRAVARAALKDLNERLTAAVQQTKDPMTLAHLEDCRQEIDQILYPKMVLPRRGGERVVGDAESGEVQSTKDGDLSAGGFEF
jgi:uncharacterized protein DUF4953/uncharacterized protein DUF5117/uncharacterized protein DUF5118